MEVVCLRDAKLKLLDKTFCVSLGEPALRDDFLQFLAALVQQDAEREAMLSVKETRGLQLLQNAEVGLGEGDQALQALHHQGEAVNVHRGLEHVLVGLDEGPQGLDLGVGVREAVAAQTEGVPSVGNPFEEIALAQHFVDAEVLDEQGLQDLQQNRLLLIRVPGLLAAAYGRLPLPVLQVLQRRVFLVACKVHEALRIDLVVGAIHRMVRRIPQPIIRLAAQQAVLEHVRIAALDGVEQHTEHAVDALLVGSQLRLVAEDDARVRGAAGEEVARQGAGGLSGQELGVAGPPVDLAGVGRGGGGMTFKARVGRMFEARVGRRLVVVLHP
mmetsp:Transcript_75401/g.245258  ORF Transcript_75401/g.245258 Transcript_75401/m.245258 type:complete len:328 (-) Transcript_75401:2682-3665(-)